MSFLVVLLALLIMYSTNMAVYFQSDKVVFPYLNAMSGLFDRFHIQELWFQGFLLVLIFSTLITGVYALLYHFFVSVIAFLFSMVVLLFCFSDKHFSAQERPELILLQAVQKLFAIIFWYFVLGIAGPVIYVLIEKIKESFYFTHLRPLMDKWQLFFDWLPIRLLGLSLAFIGYFSPVMQYWLAHAWSKPQENEEFLKGCFLASCGSDLYCNGDYAIKLVYRSLVLWLVVAAVSIVFFIR